MKRDSHRGCVQSGWLNYRTVILALVFVACLTPPAIGQSGTSPTDGSTPVGLQPGTPAGSNKLSDLESINLRWSSYGHA
jgi:hypothetical protein